MHIVSFNGIENCRIIYSCKNYSDINIFTELCWRRVTDSQILRL